MEKSIFIKFKILVISNLIKKRKKIRIFNIKYKIYKFCSQGLFIKLYLWLFISFNEDPDREVYFFICHLSHFLLLLTTNLQDRSNRRGGWFVFIISRCVFQFYPNSFFTFSLRTWCTWSFFCFYFESTDLWFHLLEADIAWLSKGIIEFLFYHWLRLH